MDSVSTIIIFVVSLILSLGFLLLVFTLIPAINQFKTFLKELEKTSSEVGELTAKLKELTDKIDEKADHLDTVLVTSKKAVEVIHDSFSILNKKVLKKSAGFLAFLPAVKFGWNLVKKRRGKGGG